MTALHSLLKRQLRRFADETIPLIEEQPDFLRVINDAYWQSDADRRMLEHSLELTSQELLEKNAELSRINDDLERRVTARTAELSKSEARFRGLFEHVPVSIWEEDFSAVRTYIDDLRSQGIVDLSTHFNTHPEVVAACAARVKIVDVNHATLEMYQANSKEQLLRDLSKVLGPESWAPFRQELLALIRGDLIFETEVINYTLGGESRAVFIRLTVAPGHEHDWAKVFVGISDITARRQAESQVRASETMFRALFDLSPDAVVVIDPHDRNVSWPIIDCNIAACLMNGYTREELVGQSIDILNLTRGTQDERTAYLEQLREAGNLKLEVLHRRKNGVVFFVEVSTTLITVGGRELVIGIDRDITKQKEIVESLRQSEERFKLMAWATKDAVWDWDLEKDQIWWGEGLQKIFHYSAEAAQSTPEWRLEHIHPDDRAKVSRTISQALESGMEFWSKEYRFQRKDISYAEIMDRGYIIRDDSGKPIRMVGAMLDITERKQMEFKLLRANEQLRQSLDELQNRNQEIALLNEMGRLLQACQSAEEAYTIIGDLASQLFPHTAGALYLLNPSRTLATAVAAWGELTLSGRTFSPNDCWALRSGQTHPLNRNENEREQHCFHMGEPPPVISLCLPIQVQSKTIGVFSVQSQKEENLNEAKRRLVYNVVEQTGMALSNLKLRDALREQSIRDPLTGLYNRRYMEESLKQQISRVTRKLHPLGIIMIDIDHFKAFNDTYGHAAGDALLQQL
ncbi:MAG: PAS domain S-box protein, partial [Anaerolineales bacterium]